jgi:uncharacterized membrane protein YfcA
MIGIGLLVGLLIGLTGIGSGSLLTPLLILLGSMSPATAVGTSISFSFITKLYGSWKFYRRGLVNMEIVRDLSMGCLPGVLVGAFIIRYLNVRRPDVMNTFLQHSIGVALIAVAIVMGARMLPESKRPAVLDRPLLLSNALRRLFIIAVGFAVGVSMTVTSIGSGAALIPAMILFYRLDSGSLVGTNLFVGTILAATAGIPHLGFGHIDWRAVAGLVCGSIPALWVSSHVHGGLPRHVTDGIIAGGLMVMGVYIIAF